VFTETGNTPIYVSGVEFWRKKMTFTEMIIFCFAVIGMTNIIVDPATIMQPLRNLIETKGPAWLNKLVSCYQCAGTWVGFFCGAVLFSPHYTDIIHKLLIVFIAGVAGSFIATWGAAYLNYLQAKTEITLDQNE
jgi:formate/nitrite transporter FocA (FNT family)